MQAAATGQHRQTPVTWWIGAICRSGFSSLETSGSWYLIQSVFLIVDPEFGLVRVTSFFFFSIFIYVLILAAPGPSCGMQYLWWTLSCSMWALIPWPGIKPGSPALGAWGSNHWTIEKSQSNSLKEEIIILRIISLVFSISPFFPSHFPYSLELLWNHQRACFHAIE